MNLFKGLLFFALLISSATATIAQNNWQLKLNKDGIQVFTQKEPGSSFDAFKGVVEISTTAEKIVAFLNNVSEYPKVFPDNSEARLIKRTNENVFAFYSRTKAPWPVDDRDGVYESTKKVNSDGSITFSLVAKPTMVEKYSGVVRIEKALTYWRIIPLSNGKIKLEYEVHTNPGGSIPEWLANSTVTDMPYKTLLNLKRYLEAKK